MDKRRPRKYEFAVLVTIIGILAVLLMRALDATREDVEEAAVQTEVAALRVELLDWLAHREVHGGKLPESRNPVRLLARQPVSYVGELDSPPQENGVWYYDRKREELVYRFRSSRETRFRLVRNTEVKNVPGVLAGVGLRRVEDAPDSVK